MINKEKSNLYSLVFNTREGQEVLEDLLSFSGFYADTFVPNDPYSTSYAAGQRRVVLRILSFLNKKEKGLIDE